MRFVPDAPAEPGYNIGAIGVSNTVFGSETNALEGNGAATGGALSIESPGQGNSNSGINGSTFANNVASGNGGGFAYEVPPGGSENVSLDNNIVVTNEAGGSGGGGYVAIDTGFLNVTNSNYENNTLDPAVPNHPASDHFGGGLYLQGGLPNLHHNVFRANEIKAFPDFGNYGGGGLAVRGPDVNAQSEYNRFEGNTLAGPAPATSFESEGGGLYFSSDGGRWQGFLDSIAGNSVGPGGEGGGIYTGASADPTSLELAETTVAGNTVGAGGQFAGIAGDPQDDLLLWNSIVYNSPQPDIGGFDYLRHPTTATRATPASPSVGPGNICADPLLVGGANVHQTAQSPTIDTGNDELFNRWAASAIPRTTRATRAPPTGTETATRSTWAPTSRPRSRRRHRPPPPPPPPPPQCSDQVDNDGDGAIDAAGPRLPRRAGRRQRGRRDAAATWSSAGSARSASCGRTSRARRWCSAGSWPRTWPARRWTCPCAISVGAARRRSSATVTPGADGQFQARVKKPSRSLFNAARYRAQVGNAKSVELKLPQSLASSSLSRSAAGCSSCAARSSGRCSASGTPWS